MRAQPNVGKVFRQKADLGALRDTPRPPMKIFQIGFNKCGTKTIHHYLATNKVRSIHWDKGRLAKRIFSNLAEGKNLLLGYDEFDAFTDMEYLDESGLYLAAYKLFPYLAAQYPDAVFILNTRDREAWIRSRLQHGSECSYPRYQMLHYNVDTVTALADRWRADWDHHHQRVIEFFEGKPYRFFVCRIETDLPHLLNTMLPECKLDSSHFGVLGASSQRRKRNPMQDRKKLSFGRRLLRRARGVFR
jgi:hypothetical protein